MRQNITVWSIRKIYKAPKKIEIFAIVRKSTERFYRLRCTYTWLFLTPIFYTSFDERSKIIAQIKELHELKQIGALTEEFEEKKAILLRDLK